MCASISQLGKARLVKLTMLRLYYVGLLQDKRPEICPYLFQVDWAPFILKFMRSSEREYSSVVFVVMVLLAKGDNLTAGNVQCIASSCHSHPCNLL